MVFLVELLHVFRGRATGAGFKQATAIHQFDNRQHLGRGSKLKDREQVGQIIAQHVAGDRDGVFALADRIQRRVGCLARSQDPEFVLNARGLEDRGHVFDQLRIMGTARIQPEDRLTAFGLLPRNGQLDPVLDRGLPCRCRAPDIARVHGMFVQDISVHGDHPHRARRCDFECRGVRAVFLGLLGHQADILDRSGGGWIKRTILFEVRNCFVIDARIGAVGDDAFGVASLPSGPQPLPPARISAGIEASMITSDGTCRLVMPLSELTIYSGGWSSISASISVDDRGPIGHPGDPVQPRSRQCRNSGPRRAASSASPCLSKTGFRKLRHRMSEDNRVGDLHHRGLQVQREQDPVLLRGVDLFGKKGVQALALMKVASTTAPAGS